MAQSGPEYRGIICKTTLEAVRRRPHCESILSAVPPASLAEIERSRSSSWVPIGYYDDIIEAVLAVEGIDGVRDLFATQNEYWGESKLFRPMMESAKRIFGLTPFGQLKWFGRAWQVTTRGMGTLETSRSEDGVRMSLTDLPHSHRIPRMIAAFEGSIQGVVASYGCTAFISVDDSEFAAGHVAFDVQWD